VVTDDSVLARDNFRTCAAAVLAAGGAGLCLHVRGPRTSGGALHELASTLLAAARTAGALLFVNDRLDVALAAGVDGGHLGARSLPVAVARRLLGPRMWLGVSCRDATQASRARRGGADYAFLGTIFPTPSHPGVAGMGAEGVTAAARALRGLPVVAIGGIDLARVPEVLAAGAYGIAVVRGVWGARDPAAAVQGYLEMIATEMEGRASGL
jgi:thiamine-phosphate pyrophosphorylase